MAKQLIAGLGAICIAIISAHEGCGHDSVIQSLSDSIDPDSVKSPQDLVSMGGSRRLKSEDGPSPPHLFRPLRIAFDLSKLDSDPGFSCHKAGDIILLDGKDYTCLQDDVITEDKVDFITKILLPTAQEYFSSVLSVQSVDKLKIPGIGCGSKPTWACCRDNYPSVFTTGIDADFLLHVTARPVAVGIIAWAIPCNTDQFGRPISGQANFGPQRLSTDPARRMDQIGTIIHELSHALGFSVSLFGSYRFPNNGPPRGAANVLKFTDGPSGSRLTHLATPKVKELVRKHFDCDQVAGGELQNDNKIGYSSHWAKRLFLNEYMMATNTNVPIYSPFTLAAFEDSGWYQVNYDGAQQLRYGHLAGCALATGRCTDWKAPLCYSSQANDCTPDYTAKGVCNLAAFSTPLPPAAQYYGTPFIGGRDAFANYCPRFIPVTDCRGILGTPENINQLETYGQTSMCFRASLTASPITQSSTQSYCFAVAGCTDTALKVQVGASTVLCPFNQGSVKVALKEEGGRNYTGTITCPRNPRDMCNVNLCSNTGVWTSKGCICSPGHGGEDCSTLLCPRDEHKQECSNNGVCREGLCECNQGTFGIACSRTKNSFVIANMTLPKNGLLLIACGLVAFAAIGWTYKKKSHHSKKSKSALLYLQTKNTSYGTDYDTVLSINQ